MKIGKNSISQKTILKWLPAVLLMTAIYLFSAGSSMDMPSPLLERIVNKGGHMIGYGLLALSYWRIFDFRGDRRRLAWALAVLYALTDEFHQTLVPGRHGTIIDVLVYDNLGAFLFLWLASLYLKQKQPVPQGLVVEEETLSAKS